MYSGVKVRAPREGYLQYLKRMRKNYQALFNHGPKTRKEFFKGRFEYFNRLVNAREKNKAS